MIAEAILNKIGGRIAVTAKLKQIGGIEGGVLIVVPLAKWLWGKRGAR